MPPQCVFVTGPRGAGKTRWVQENILKLVAAHPGLHCAVVLAEDGHTRMERFAHEVPDVAVRRVLLPCPCCPAHAYLPETIRQLTSETGADWLFVETPAVATAGLLGEFDRELGWPRQIVLCVDEKWERLRHRGDAPPFLATLSEHADLVVASSRPCTDATADNVILADIPSIVLT
jgi:Ni2+-binding GTPase involved in maturation of urease and hydrogenase